MRSSVAATLLLSSLSLSSLGLAACSATPAVVAVPDAIKAQPGEQVAMVVPAKGVQIYECRAKAGQPGAFEWAFVAPDAALYNTSGTQTGKHYGGPTWESNDGSKLVGALKARSDAPQKAGMAAGDIPWLLLTTTASGAKGSFSNVTAIQRVNTVGGIAPAATCAQGNAGSQARVPYTADYYLLAKK
jgi:hypothetical protein